MVDVGLSLLDPFTIRTIVSIVAGAVTALIVVRLNFFLHNQRDLFRSIRAIKSELDYDVDQLSKLSNILKDDMRRQQVDLPVEIPPGTRLEVRYVLSIPGSMNTSAFTQLKQTGRLIDLPRETQRALFDLYDVIDRINRLREHRETLHYNHVGNVHIVVDAIECDLDPKTTVTEADLPPAVSQQLNDLRQMRQAMKGINTSILRLLTAISSSELIADLEMESYVETDSDRVPVVPTIEETITLLDDFERRSFWARFV